MTHDTNNDRVERQHFIELVDIHEEHEYYGCISLLALLPNSEHDLYHR